MAFLKYFKRLFKKSEPEPDLHYVRDEPVVSKEELYQLRSVQIAREMENDIDLSRQADLEGYAKDINVSKESIERWISSGLLMPEELKVAEKLIKIMRKH